ncbi:AT-hook motif nuclear-localized protein 10 [Raphanus sativus]|nr:AT-hook motif nuclear-localized protein 10 [Raphanus sativus]
MSTFSDSTYSQNRSRRDSCLQAYKLRDTSTTGQQEYQQNSASGLNMKMPVTGSERVKKRRGKPRKYRPETNEAPLVFVPGPPSFTVSQPSGDCGGCGPVAEGEPCLLLRR